MNSKNACVYSPMTIEMLLPRRKEPNGRMLRIFDMRKPKSASRGASLAYLARNAMFLALAFLSKLSLQREIVILMYHSVDSTDDRHAVNPEEFKHQMEYLRKNYAIVTLNEILDFIQGKRNLPRKAVSITFDDGYHDFYSNVYPYLSMNGLPATVFVTTGYVSGEWPLSSSSPKTLTWNEIEEMSKNNIEIGAHTVTHPNLQKIGIREAEDEIVKSRGEIEKHIKKCVDFFSYPFGKYRPDIVDEVKSLGFKAAVGGGGTIRKDACVFTLNRIQVDSTISFMLFKAQLTKAVDWYKRLEYIPKVTLAKIRSLPHSVLRVIIDRNNETVTI